MKAYIKTLQARLSNIVAEQNFHILLAQRDLALYGDWHIDYSAIHVHLQHNFQETENYIMALLAIEGKDKLQCTRLVETDDNSIIPLRVGKFYAVKTITANGFAELVDYPGLHYSVLCFTSEGS